jgi:predicted alpha/beta superfamily hydrolase
MLKKVFVAPLVMAAVAVFGQYHVKFQINSLPAYQPPGSDIYVASSFNGWNPHDEKFKMQQNKNGNYFIDLQLQSDIYEYKITRGGWDKVECHKEGEAIENRILKVESDTMVELNIENWADRFASRPKASTAGKNVHIIDTAFLIPQLKRIRRVWIYLPENYSHSKKRYPVLYMQDGQNIFDEATSYAGEWGVDEYLDSLRNKNKECIVVAVDHGGDKRLTEYDPYDNEKFGKGEGKKYAAFLVKTLKPFIDKHYRTLKKKENTFIAGSSMGGLISMYAILKYPETFGGAGIFSPAFWVGPAIYNDLNKMAKKVKGRVYFYCGKMESDSMVPDMMKAFEIMSQKSSAKTKMVIRDSGKHNEAAWRKEFPLFYQWIFSSGK